MKLKEVKELLGQLIDGMNAGIPQMAVCLWGTTGVGKTTLINDVAKETGYKPVTIMASELADLGDITGIPYPTKKGVTRWFPNEELQFTTESKIILFLDEFNRAAEDIRRGLFRLIHEKKIHGTTLPEKTLVVLAANPAGEQYETDEITDAAFIARMSHLIVEPTLEEWAVYTEKEGGDPSVIATTVGFKLLENNIRLIQEGIPQRSVNPRSLTYLAKMFQMFPALKQNSVFREFVIGLIGANDAANLFTNLDRPFNYVKAKEFFSAGGPKKYNEQETYLKIGTLFDVKNAIKSAPRNKRQELFDYSIDHLNRQYLPLFIQVLSADIKTETNTLIIKSTAVDRLADILDI